MQAEEWVRGPSYVSSPDHTRHLASVFTVSWEVGTDTLKVNDSSRVTEPGSPPEQRGLGGLYQHYTTAHHSRQDKDLAVCCCKEPLGLRVCCFGKVKGLVPLFCKRVDVFSE